MKQVIRLAFIIGVMFGVFQLVPNIKVTSKQTLSRTEAHGISNTQNVPTETETPVSGPENKPEQVAIKPEEPKPVQQTAPVEPPKPANNNSAGDCSLVYQYDWPQNVAYAVCLAESSNNYLEDNMNDHHGSCVGSYSLMQVGCFWYPYYGYSSKDFYNAQINVEIAYKIWARQGGFGAWTAYTSGKYTKYLR